MPIRHLPIKTLVEGMPCDSVYLVRRRLIATAKTGRSYLNLTLSDASGEVTARVFNNVELYSRVFSEGDFILVQARVQIYEGKTQLLVDALERVPPGDIDPNDFLPSGPYPAAALLGHVKDILGTIGHDKLREVCLAALEGETGERFARAPAAQSMHHPYIGGLLTHTLSVLMLLDGVCRHYKNVDRDIVLAGGFFHDIGKIYELEYDRAINYSDHGRLVPHLIIGVQIFDRLCAAVPEFPNDVRLHIEHIILSHHGEREFGSPVIPATVEAVVVHHIDNMDSKVCAYLTHVEKAPGEAQWTDRHFLLGTNVKRTTDVKEQLYDFHLPGEKPEVPEKSAEKDMPGKKDHGKGSPPAPKQFDLLDGKS